jgi:hypothetical protein
MIAIVTRCALQNWVVAHLPNLKNMDFGTITKVERDKIETWFKSTKKKH